jgi:hypothetical protein
VLFSLVSSSLVLNALQVDALQEQLKLAGPPADDVPAADAKAASMRRRTVCCGRQRERERERESCVSDE